MLRRRLGRGIVIAYPHLGPKYRLLTPSSAYARAELTEPRSPRDLVLLDTDDVNSGSPWPGT
ncbi:MAG: hypothetical protein QHH27_04590 [Clostridia bacterium]|nr:hypothetical protein [Clostridia bacterium]MDH7572814.1 hypothetical protein [Clostridia bacterium]